MDLRKLLASDCYGIPTTKRGYCRMDITGNCNIRCIQCQLYNTMEKADLRLLDFETFEKNAAGFLDRFQVVQIGHTAEPTIHPRFADFIRFIRSQTNSVIQIVTNGLLLDRYADVINEARCLVQVSVDSLKPETYAVVRVGSNYNKVFRNLGLIDQSRSAILLCATLMRCNVDEYDDFVSFCREKDYALSVFPMQLREENGVIPKRLVDESLWFDKPRIKRWIDKHFGQDYGKTAVGATTGVAIHWDQVTCRAHEIDLGIAFNGVCNICFKQTIGNINRDTLTNIWNSQKAVEFRGLVDLDRTPCRTCDYLTRCVSPSLLHFQNHVSERIYSKLADETKAALAFDSPLADDDQKAMFVSDVARNWRVFDFESAEGKVRAVPIVLPHFADEGESAEALRADDEAIEGKNVLEVMRQIEEVHGAPTTPRLLGPHRDHNIVRYGRLFWGIPLRLGIIDLTNPDDRVKPGIFSGKTRQEIEQGIDRQHLLVLNP